MSFNKAVVFGATGVVGRTLAGELKNRGISTRVVSRSREKLERDFGSLDVEIQTADLADEGASRRAAQGCDLVFHCLGIPMERYELHLTTTRATVAAIKANDARGVLISSYWVYGPSHGDPVTEDAPRRPKSRYERIRVQQEEIFRDGGGTVALLPDFYGPGAEIGFVNPALQAFLQGKAANWIGPLDRERELIYAPDVGCPLVELAGKPETRGESVNLPGPGVITPRRLLEVGASLCGARMKVRTAGPFLILLLGFFNREIRSFRPLGELYRHPVVLDGGKAEHLIGDYPRTDYASGIRKTVEWLRR